MKTSYLENDGIQRDSAFHKILIKYGIDTNGEEGINDL